ncbi:DUF4381 domain-containing protein [Candidatus Competibacter phosphatis]|uniref:DUF4381 domain-containing protein n=1 Tax=Candidatus Competibacter phosphatis TaxID=221280 RepID=A0ABX1TEU3_9GAMM|nr:DUF4381 domain-containing protein [Candidatus Competibacter phosphatis]NMQ17878.1 DUF4381 domain-containing protein [Candidatus Competibacter phosphatis]
MNTNATSLDRLHDIIVAPPVPWWPPASGWYWVLGLMIVILLATLITGLMRWQHNRYRREALAELARQEAALENPERRPGVLLDCAELLKRTAMTAFPREDVATLTGPKWFEFLDHTASGSRFRDALGATLENAIYDPRTADSLDPRKLHSVVEAIRHWIKFHDTRLEPQAGGTPDDEPAGGPPTPARSSVGQLPEKDPC